MAVPQVRATEASLREVRQALQQINLALFTPPKHNWTATADPTATDDATAGYSQGSWWYRASSESLWLCTNATPSNATWDNTVGSTILGAAVAFKTITCQSGTHPVADATADELTLAAPHAGLTVTGAVGTDTVTFNLVEGSINHDALLNFAAGEHFTEASIAHGNIQDVGSNSHAQIDTALGTALTAAATIDDLEIVIGAGGSRGTKKSGVSIDASENIKFTSANPTFYINSGATKTLEFAESGSPTAWLKVEAQGGQVTVGAQRSASSAHLLLRGYSTGYVGIQKPGDTTKHALLKATELTSTRLFTFPNAAGTFELEGHASKHVSGGADAIKLDDLAAPDDNTDLDVGVGAHGLCPKGDNDATHYLNGTGAWSEPAGGGGVAAHAILDGDVHTDSVADAVTRGSLIVGNSTPKWDELVAGSGGTFLRTDGTDAYWAFIEEADISDYTALTAAATIDTDALVVGDGNNRTMVKTGIKVDASDNMTIPDDAMLLLGNAAGTDAALRWHTATVTRNYLCLGLGLGADANSGYFMICETGNWTNAEPAASTINPTLRLWSGLITAGTEWLEFYHDDTDATVDWGKGNLNLDGGDVDITAGDLIVSGDIEAETTIGFDAVYDKGNISGEVTIDWNNGNMQEATLTGDVTGLAFTDPPNPGFYHLRLIQDGTGGRTVVWDSVDYWIRGGRKPVVSTSAAARDWFDFAHDGTLWEGAQRPNFATPV